MLIPQHTPEPCPSADELAELLSRAAEPEAVMAIRQHLEHCGPCRKAVAAAGDDDNEAPLFMRPGSKLGRYVIQDVIGVGGMGIVYAGHDTVLDRKVALKVLLPLPESVSTDDERAWLEREAQAMAQLSHPNVVTVFDVGDAGSYLYLAMELVAGRPLNEWLTYGPEMTQVLEAFLAAGHGLAAVHSAGIVHGDFKPSNVLVGDDGGVQVTDFGLALRATEPAAATMAGGTPRYLAPERKCGGGPSVASDVYSYCASLYEALTHQHPSDDDELEALAALELTEPLRSALRHGLAVDPNERASNLDVILGPLASVVQPQPARTRSSRWWLVAGIGVAGIGGGATWAVTHTEGPCANVRSEFEEVWNTTRRAGLRSGLSSVRAGFGESTSNRVDALLDAYAGEWISMRRETCEATLVRHEESADMMVRRLQCLEGRKQAFDAVVEVLESPGLVRLEEASLMAAELPPLSLCTDDRYVSAAVPPPEDPATAAGVEAIRADLARIQALLDAPDHTAARRLATEALDAARQLPYEPILVEALKTSALVFIAQGNYEAALVDANAAYEQADAASRSTAADLHLQLSRIHQKKGELEAALREARKSLGIASKAFGDEHPAVAHYHIAIGLALGAMGRSADSLAEYERALQLLGGSPGAGDMLAGVLHNNIGAANYQQGNYAEALAAFRRALSIRELHLGPDHPRIAASHSNIGGALYAMGRYEAGLAAMRLGLAIRQASLEPGHPSIADVRTNIGLALYQIGDYEGALKEHREALSISEAALGDSHPDVALSHSNIGMALHRLGNMEAALAEFRTALAGIQDSLGPTHPRVAEIRVNLGSMLNEKGRHQEGLDELRAALAIFEAVLPPGHPSLGTVHLDIGVTLHSLGRHDEALDELHQALALRRASLGEDHPAVASARMNLGVTLYTVGRYDDALAEFRQTLAIQRESLPPDHPQIADAAAATVFAAAKAGAADAIPPALDVLDDVIARRPDDIMLPALRRMLGVVTAAGGMPGHAEISAVEAAREIIGEQGPAHFAAIADAWLAEQRP